MIDIDGVLMVPDDIRVERRALRARIAKLEAERQWQPIETAPRDEFLLGRCEWRHTSYVSSIIVQPNGSIITEGFKNQSEVVVTHWMPAPSTEVPDGNV